MANYDKLEKSYYKVFALVEKREEQYKNMKSQPLSSYIKDFTFSDYWAKCCIGTVLTVFLLLVCLAAGADLNLTEIFILLILSYPIGMVLQLIFAPLLALIIHPFRLLAKKDAYHRYIKAKNRKERLLKERVNKIKLEIKKYVGNPKIKEIAQFLLPQLLSNVEQAARGSNVENVNAKFNFCIKDNSVRYWYKYTDYGEWKTGSNIFSFESHRFEKLPNQLSVDAVTIAVVEQLINDFKQAYPLDNSGSQYSITYDLWERDDRWFMDNGLRKFDYITEIHYNAKNGYYKDTTSW